MSDAAFGRALARFTELDAIAMEPIAPAGSGFCFTHGRRTASATLFLHGLTASPRQFAALAVHAFRGGENVIVPRLPRHGHLDRMSETLAYLRTAELLGGVEAQLEIARQLGETVRVVGFSLGGLLVAWIAAHHVVRRAIAIAPFLGILGVPWAWTAAVASELHRRPNAFVWWDPIRRENLLPAHGYPRYASHAVAEALELAVQLVRGAASAAPLSPITLVSNANETAVSNAAIARLAALWRRRSVGLISTRRIAGIGPSHDIIEPERNRLTIARSYPALLALLDE